MKSFIDRIDTLHQKLAIMGGPTALFGLRAILAYTFMDAGLRKVTGSNWFANIQSGFPFPFDMIPPELSWFIASWTEILGGAMLLLGLGTRYAAFALMVLTAVATAAVHWPDSFAGLAELWKGFAISDEGHGNFRLPLILFLMLLPLLFNGSGRLGVDALIHRSRQPESGSIEGRATLVNEAMMVLGALLVALGLVVTVTWGWLTLWQLPVLSLAGLAVLLAGVWRSGAATTFSSALVMGLVGIPLFFLFPVLGVLLVLGGIAGAFLACSSLQSGRC